jgi:hypothetical protein
VSRGAGIFRHRTSINDRALLRAAEVIARAGGARRDPARSERPPVGGRRERSASLRRALDAPSALRFLPPPIVVAETFLAFLPVLDADLLIWDDKRSFPILANLVLHAVNAGVFSGGAWRQCKSWRRQDRVELVQVDRGWPRQRRYEDHTIS